MTAAEARRVAAQCRRRGFDLARCDGAGGVDLGCSQCLAVAINGVPCHERGCPNQVGCGDWGAWRAGRS
jgi:hypothetical protein